MSDVRDAAGTIFGFPRRIAGGFAIAFAALALSAAFSFAALSARAKVGELAAHAQACLLAAEEVEVALAASHSELEEYVEDDVPGALQRFQQATASIPPALAAFSEAVAARPETRSRFEAVQAAASRLAAQQATVVAALAEGKRTVARARLAAIEEGALLEAAIQALQDVERLAMGAATEGSVRRARTITISTSVFIAAELLLLVLIVVAARTVRDEVRARERAMHVQQRLMAIVSHDLRNPLSAVLGSAWTLGRADLPPDASRAVSRISSSARRMHRLIRDVLDWSRAHAGAEIPVAPRDTDLYELCARVAEDLDRPAGERIRLVSEGDPRAKVDPDRMEQVIANLLSNALRYAPPNRPVRVRVAGSGPEVRIEVSDDGPGIAPEVRAWIFEPFRTAAPTDGSGGGRVGLGLFIVRTLAEAHGGRVRVESAPDAGTTFVVEVPRAPAVAAPVVAQA